MDQTCLNCGRPGVHKCGRCKKAFYCSPDCQAKHWKSGHKGQCKIVSDVQKADILADTNDPPLVANPSVYLFPPDRVEKMMTFEEPIEVGSGLRNSLNTCFVNSVLQVLTYTVPYRNFLLYDRHCERCNALTHNKFCIQCIMSEHMLYTIKYAAFMPRNILTNLRRFGEYQLGQQEDAHEFYKFFIQKAHDEMYREALAQLGKKIEDPNDRYHVESTTLMYQIFGGYLESRIKCHGCGKTKKMLESFLDLNLGLSNDAKSVEETLENYITIEDIEYNCEECKGTKARKQLTINQAPNILTLMLKKFDMTQGGIKINKDLTFLETLDISRLMSNPDPQGVKYELYAVIVHYGQTVISGHYCTFVKIDGKWVLYDDDKVTELPNSSVVHKQNPYIFFYKKTTPTILKPQPEPQQSPPQLSTSRRGGRGGRGRGRGGRGAPQSPQAQSNTTTTEPEVEPPEPLAPVEQLLVIPEEPALKTTMTKAIFYLNMNEDDGSMEIVMKLGISPEEVKKATVNVSSSGKISISTAQSSLSFNKPFVFSTPESRCRYFPEDKKLVLVLPILQLQQSQDKSLVTLEVVEVEGLSSEIEVGEELEIEDDKQEESQTTDANISTNNAAIRVNSHENKGSDEASYRYLYSEIKKARDIAREQGTQPSKPRGKMPKLKNNDKCCCGSGRKYKDCHLRLK